jgi:hypothetical protein
MVKFRDGKIKALLIAGVIAGSLVLGMWTYSRLYAATNTSSVTFGPAWHYVGNTTLTGSLAQQVCYAFPIPSCTPWITFPAQEYNNGTATAYLVKFTGSGGGTGPGSGLFTDYAVIINSAAYCNSNFSADGSQTPATYLKNCPSVIN